MSTIFTDDFAYQEVDFEIGEPSLGHAGRELCMSSGDKEIRVVLTDEQLGELANLIAMEGIERGAA